VRAQSRLTRYGQTYSFYSIQIVTGAALQMLGAWLRYFSTFVQNEQGRFALAMIGQVSSALPICCIAYMHRVNLSCAVPADSVRLGATIYSQRSNTRELCNTVLYQILAPCRTNYEICTQIFLSMPPHGSHQEQEQLPIWLDLSVS
jgi:hypothetical protein